MGRDSQKPVTNSMVGGEVVAINDEAVDNPADMSRRASS